MKFYLAAIFCSLGLAGCQSTVSQLTPAQDAALVGVAASTGAAVATAVKPSIGPQAGAVGAAVAGGAQGAAVILTPPTPPAK